MITVRLNTPIYATRVCLGTRAIHTLLYIVPYSPYKTTEGTHKVSHVPLSETLVLLSEAQVPRSEKQVHFCLET